jgi:hypothetical protein
MKEQPTRKSGNDISNGKKRIGVADLNPGKHQQPYCDADNVARQTGQNITAFGYGEKNATAVS